MSGLRIEELPSALLSALPEFRSEYEEHIQDNGEPLPHVLFGDLMAFVSEQWQPAVREANGPARDILWRFSQFIEQLAESDDEYIQNLLCVSYLEGLVRPSSD